MNRPNYNYNMRTVPRGDFNCGGYALETLDWFLPYDKKSEFNPYAPAPDGDAAVYFTDYFVNYMLGYFGEKLRVIHSLDELQEDEYAFAFRIGIDEEPGYYDDFHFVKRGDNGQWYHKMGASARIKTMPEEQVFSESWGWRYNGPLVLFAKLREDNRLG